MQLESRSLASRWSVKEKGQKEGRKEPGQNFPKNERKGRQKPRTFSPSQGPLPLPKALYPAPGIRDGGRAIF